MAPQLSMPTSTSLWSHFDASKPKLSLRQLFYDNQPTSSGLSSSGVVAVAFGVAFAILCLSCCLAVLCKNQKPVVTATVPPPLPRDLVDPTFPPPPYPSTRPASRASMEMEMRELARPTVVRTGALGKAGFHGVPTSDVPLGATSTAVVAPVIQVESV